MIAEGLTDTSSAVAGRCDQGLDHAGYAPAQNALPISTSPRSTINSNDGLAAPEHELVAQRPLAMLGR